METDLQHIVRKRLTDLGMGAVEAATRAGLERNYIRDIVDGKKRTVRSDKIEALARALSLDPSELAQLSAQPVAEPTVPLMGYVGAGGDVDPDVEQVPEGGLEGIVLPFPIPAEMIAFQVKGDSMLPQFADGMVIVVYRERRRPIEAFYGRQACVLTEDGRRFIKTIERGDRGRVTLTSWNARPIENIRLTWIGEIFTYLPAESIRSVSRADSLRKGKSAA